jgi:hypothetical protein
MSLKPMQRSAEFTEILGIIQAGRAKAFEAVNAFGADEILNTHLATNRVAA